MCICLYLLLQLGRCRVWTGKCTVPANTRSAREVQELAAEIITGPAIPIPLTFQLESSAVVDFSLGSGEQGGLWRSSVGDDSSSSSSNEPANERASERHSRVDCTEFGSRRDVVIVTQSAMDGWWMYGVHVELLAGRQAVPLESSTAHQSRYPRPNPYIAALAPVISDICELKVLPGLYTYTLCRMLCQHAG